MITADPQRRVSTLARILDHVSRTAPPTPIATYSSPSRPSSTATCQTPWRCGSRPRRSRRGWPASSASSRATMPPAVQLYKGLPGLHVAVRNPDDAEAAAPRRSTHEVTIVETHTPDAPFIFESLKNYFQKEGLRVFSAIHPIFSVRRQWERVVWIGGAAGGRLARALLPVPHRARRGPRAPAPHRAPGVLGAEGGVPRRRGLPRHAPRHRRAGAAAARPQRRHEATPTRRAPFLDWLMADNYVMLGVERYTLRARRPAARAIHDDARSASSRTRRCCPSSSPA